MTNRMKLPLTPFHSLPTTPTSLPRTPTSSNSSSRLANLNDVTYMLQKLLQSVEHDVTVAQLEYVSNHLIKTTLTILYVFAATVDALAIFFKFFVIFFLTVFVLPFDTICLLLMCNKFRSSKVLTQQDPARFGYKTECHLFWSFYQISSSRMVPMLSLEIITLLQPKSIVL